MPLPAIPPGLERKADDALDALVASVGVIQAGVLAAEGRFFQGLPSHAALPQNGADVAHDRLASKPSDRAKSWANVGIVIAPGPIRFRVDEYLGPDGAGWSVTAEIEIAGRLWARTVDGAGPETRAREWTDVTNDA